MGTAIHSPSRVFIATPGTAEANNGNWRTARRWATFLHGATRTIVQSAWSGEDADVLVALHGARSAASIARFRDAHPDRPVVLVLTGTDLYRDLPRDPSVRRSLAIADRVVVLQADALAHVPPEFRAKCRVIFQSARPLAARRSLPRSFPPRCDPVPRFLRIVLSAWCFFLFFVGSPLIGIVVLPILRLFAKDREGRVLLANDAAVRATGKRLDEVLGRSE
ncbi:MAG TPA: hypothetical protein PLD37_10125, partial [Usitatibacteraceae bacterium]|nr:hypothetical protein [Usitatibacteraceae bacterium]